MNRRHLIIASALVVGVATTSLNAALAANMPGCGFRLSGPPGMMHRHGPWHHGFLRGLDLSRVQRDRIFQIFYAIEPAMRQKRLALRHDRRQLATAAMSDPYDARLVQVLAKALAKTQEDLTVIRSQAINRAYRVLTPQQRAELARWRQDHERH